MQNGDRQAAGNGIEYIYEVSERQLHAANKRGGSVVSYLNSGAKLDAVNVICQNDEINR